MDGLGDWPVFGADVAFEVAQEALSELGLSDGLPLVPPTDQRLAAMLAAAADPAFSHGQLPPLFGSLTSAAVAYNCVLAGCLPGALPVVLTAVVACMEEKFNLLGLATTTGSPAVATVVHGPAAGALGMNGGINCLGPGSPANATLGRAVSLVLRNIAGMRSGAGDMATMGQPGKYSFCFTERESSPFSPLHVRRGLPDGSSAVTVFGVSGTIEVLPSSDSGNWDSPEAVLDPVVTAMRAVQIVGGGARKPEASEQVLLLPPELAALIAQRGWDLARVQRYIFEGAAPIADGPIAASPDDIHVVVTGGPGNKMTVLPLWGGGTRAVTHKMIVP
ncbi:MAG: hypothetical protein ACR2OV_00855 [Hyphomicrobiaceae bacterium]